MDGGKIMKKIFVAGASSEAAEVSAAMAMLRPAGWEVTCDWPEMQRHEPKILDPCHAEKICQTLINGLMRADILWVMLPRVKSEGAFWEFGAFYGMHCNQAKGGIIVSGDLESEEAQKLGRLYPYGMGAKGILFHEHFDALSYLLGMGG
jgi:hypothetical protein